MSKIEHFEAATSSTGLVSMQFVERICDARMAALAKVSDAAAALTDIFSSLGEVEAIAGVAHDGHGCARHSTREEGDISRLFGADFDGEASFVAFRRNLDAKIWTRLLEQTGLRTMMDHQERREFDTSLRGDDVPEATLENVSATFQRLCGDAETIFLRGLARSFSGLDRRFKSHDGFKVGSRIILNRICGEFGSWNYSSDIEGTFIDIERVFAMLDGEQPAGGSLRRAIEADRRGYHAQQSETETRYFKVRIFKNGNAHLWMQRADLVEKVNRKLAEYYGKVLADAAPADCGPDIFETRSNVPSKDLAFYPTPAAAALAVKEVYVTPGMRVLEPSAGIGNLVWPLLNKGAHVDAIEIHPGRASALEGRKHPNLTVKCANFLKVQPQEIYDAVILNPPFSGTHWMDHLMHAWAFLKPGGKLVAILPASAEVNETAKHEKFRAWAKKVNRNCWGRMFTDLPPESFREVGVNINTVILHLTK